MSKKFIVQPKKEHDCASDDKFWTDIVDDGLEDEVNKLEPVNKDPKFPKVPKSRGFPRNREYQALHNIARRIRPILRASLVRGINAFKKKIDLNDLAEAISEARPEKALEAVPWDEFQGAVKGLDKAILDGVVESGQKSKFLFKRSIESLIPTIDSGVVFDSSNPDISRWIEGHLGELITNIKDNTKVAIQDIMREALDKGIPPRQSAKLIQQIVGLNERQAKAVLNRRNALERSGLRGQKLEDTIEKYVQKQLKYRGELIARTEAMTANNRGMMEVIGQNANQGLFDRRKAMKKWIVTPYDRVCKLCKPMANKMVPLDQNFTLRNGVSLSHPPAHPNCNCAWALVLPEDSV